MVDLRPYQIEGIEKIEAAWKSGVRRVMFQMPTGTGKTVVFNQIVKQELEQNSTSTVLILAHRQELIEQNVERLRTDFQIEAGMIMGDNPVNLALPVQVASIQTLSRRDYPSLNPSLIIIDEAHHVGAASYKKLLSEYPDARLLGVTASPTRLSGEGFTDSFDKLITSKSIKDFIKDEHLADIQYIGRRQIWSKLDLNSISINNTGDYDPNQLSLMMQQDFVMANLIQSYVKYAEKKKMIVFAVNVEHSKYIVERYQEAGFRAAHIDADTDESERKEIINKFKAGKIRILSNVDIVSEGFDVPDCEVVQLARPTKSLVKYLQQIGRCMRPSKTTNKTHCIVLDNVGLYQEFGSPRDPRDWTLEATPKHLRNLSSSSRNSEPRFRTNPEETDEDLIILEDVDMPSEDETIVELLAETDDESTEVSTVKA
jgi:superfamily II DNA or RNA helicase